MRAGELEALAGEEASILLLVQPGRSGDEYARKIHAASRHRDGPFLRYKCGAQGREGSEARSERLDRGCALLFALVGHGTLFFRDVHQLASCEQRQLYCILDEARFWLPDAECFRPVRFRMIASTTPDAFEGSVAGAMLHRFGERVLRVPCGAETTRR